WGPVMWVMLGEMFPNQIRGSGLAVAGLAQWVANFVITWTFPVLLAGIGLAAAYGLYAAAAFLSVFFVLRFVRETRGRELEQMQGGGRWAPAACQSRAAGGATESRRTSSWATTW